MRIADSFEKTLMLGMIEGWKEKGMTEDEMVGWHHQLNGHEPQQTPGDSGGQRSLVLETVQSQRVRRDLVT